MKISLCITVKNEEQTIAKLLGSIVAGTKKPNEIVVVDGGSLDNTLSEIFKFQESNSKQIQKIKFKIIKTKKEGIAAGRNESIKNSKGEIVVLTDAGCVVKKDWLAKITEPFRKKDVDIVAGFYEMPENSPLQAAINVFHGVPPQRFDPKSFIPSARSVAFKKTVWESVNGFREDLKNSGEDTDFFYKSVKNNFKIKRVGQARVIWEETRNMTLGKSLKKFFNYAKGDARTGIWWHPTKRLASHNIKILSIFIRYFLALIFLVFSIFIHLPLAYWFIGLFIYLFYPIFKWSDVVSDWRAKLWLPVVQISSDFAVMAGFLTGIIG